MIFGGVLFCYIAMGYGGLIDFVNLMKWVV
jgi:hypothetical protein